MHLSADLESSLFLALAAVWMAVVVASSAGGSSPFRAALGADRMREIALSAVPTLLVVATLLVAHSAASQGEGANLRLGEWSTLQVRWTELGWLAAAQPLAAIVWLACASGHRADLDARRPRAWRWIALDRDLLTTALLFGGWQGPLVGRCPALGLAYTALKAAALSALHAWIAARAPPVDTLRRARRVWLFCVPLAALNLLFAVALVVLR